MKTSETLKELMASLLLAQAQIKNMSPNKKAYNYSYVDLAKILDETKPILISNNLLIIQSVSTADTGVGITTRLQHISGEWMEDVFTLPAVNQKSMNDVQGLGASITYGRRYGISCFLGIATDEDVDGHIEPEPKKEKPFDRNKAIQAIEDEMQKVAMIMGDRDIVKSDMEKAKTKADFINILTQVRLYNAESKGV